MMHSTLDMMADCRYTTMMHSDLAMMADCTYTTMMHSDLDMMADCSYTTMIHSTVCHDGRLQVHYNDECLNLFLD